MTTTRRRATVATNWARSLRFLSTPLANASFRGDSQNVALLAAGVARGEMQVARVILRIQPNPQQPHSATADFDLVRLEMENEVGRERWTLSLQFQFLTQIPTELIAFNPMGIVITYPARRPRHRHRRLIDDRALAGKGSQAGAAWMDRPGGRMDRPCVPPQRRVHAGAVL